MPNKYILRQTINGTISTYEFEAGDYHRHTWEILDQLEAEVMGLTNV